MTPPSLQPPTKKTWSDASRDFSCHRSAYRGVDMVHKTNTAHNTNSNTNSSNTLNSTQILSKYANPLEMICDASGGESRKQMSVVSVDGSHLSAVSLAVESSLGLSEDMNDVNPPGCRSESSSLDVHQKFWLDHVPLFEPLKLCLDDSSTEGDEDMFDDDAFTFGDEDFQTLMSHDSMKRLTIKSQALSCRHEISVAEMSADITAISSHLPLHEEGDKETSKSNASMYSSSGTSSVSFTQHLNLCAVRIFT